jgi:hypothetical protein
LRPAGLRGRAAAEFSFPGYWLYVGSEPILHVIHREQLHEHRAGVIDHMAFTATDLPGTVGQAGESRHHL